MTRFLEDAGARNLEDASSLWLESGGVASSVPATQTHFRWRNDDGSETAATWKAAEDTGVSHALATNVRLRTQFTVTGDPAATAYKLYYKKSTDSEWLIVPGDLNEDSPVVFTSSPNITAGGEPTTAQLTPPTAGYLFSEDWNTADASNWDWLKWPHQRPSNTIVSGAGFQGSGSPSQAYADQYVSDFEMKVKVTWTSAINGQYPEIAWRINDGMANATGQGYIIQIVGGTGQVDIFKVGGYTSIANVTDASLTAAGTRWFKIRVVGNNHKVRWWNDGSAEPGTWQLDGTDATPPTDSWGFPLSSGGIGFRNYGAGPLSFDDLTVTDLASPPTPPDGSMRVLSQAKVSIKQGDASVFEIDTDLSWCCWFMLSGAPSGVTGFPIMSLYSGGTPYCITGVLSTFQLYQGLDDADIYSGYTLSNNTWYFVGMARRMAGGTDLYYAPQGGSLTKVSHATAKGTVINMYGRLLSDAFGACPYLNGCAFKIWTAVLSQADFTAEMPYYSAQRTSGLFVSHSMRDGLDYRADNAPADNNWWLVYESGGVISGPKATHLT